MDFKNVKLSDLTKEQLIDVIKFQRRTINSQENFLINISHDLRYSSLKEVKNDVCKVKNEKYISSKFSLPGFRGDSWICKIIATFWYLTIAIIPYTYYEDGTLKANFKHAIFMPIVIFLLTLLYGNYLNILDKLPLTKQTNKIKCILGVVFYTFLIIFIYGILTDSLYIS